MPNEFDPKNTTVEEVHDLLCEDAMKLGNNMVDNDPAIPRKYKGPVFRNGSPYNDGRLVLEITEEYQTVPDRIKAQYRTIAANAIRMAVMQNQDVFVGMIFGEARSGRNYFDRWTQAPERLFD